MGAGVIPFAVSGGQVQFLFQQVFSGRKAGFLIDFGGGQEPGELPPKCAAREFVEETETLYFADDLAAACRAPDLVERQIPMVEQLFDATLSAHPDWCCRRAPGDPRKPKDWTTYFIEFPFRDIDVMNRQWAEDCAGRFKKRRALIWLTAAELLEIYALAPERLWKRVRQLEGAPALVSRIREARGGG